MAENVTTKLEVQGASQWVDALTKAASAQQTLFDAVSRKAPRVTIGEGLVQSVLAIDNAKAATARLLEQNKQWENTLPEVTAKVAGNTKALLENAVAAEKAAQHQRSLAEASRTAGAQRGPLIGDLTRGQQSTARDQALFQQAVPATDNRLAAARDARARFLQQQVQQEEAAAAKLIRGAELREQRRNEILARGIEERGKRLEQDVKQSQANATRLQQINESSLRAEELLEKQRERVAQEATRKRISNQSQFSSSDALFRRTHPAIVNAPTTGFDNAPTRNLTEIAGATRQVTVESEKKNRALSDQERAERRSGAAGITYLSTLSAIHSASFLLSNQTFTTVGSLLTLGFAFGKLGPLVGFIGVTIGGMLSFVGSLITAFERLVQGVQLVGTAFVATAAIIAAGTAAATTEAVKLASTVESTFSEIVAFGEPGKFTGSAVQDLTILESTISGIGRKFGISANDVTAASSQYIRAGNDIESAINGGAEAVIRLQVASRGELIPTQAARAVSVLSNSFKELQGDAGKASDIIIATGQRSALTMTEVSQAFQQAGPSAAQYNISATDLAATLAVLANNGLRGQVAGTGFKQVMLDLVNPSEKAAKALKENNVSVVDLNGNIRPLGDIIHDLNRAFGEEARALDKTGDASKAQGLAMIFGSRANLAASIIARTGAADFNKMRESIENVSSTDIVNTLLAPTAAQAAIAAVNVQELGRAFGGPLNVGIGSAISQVNKFLQSIDRSHFETAGQAVIALATGQGFGPIVASLDELAQTQPEVANFLTELLNNLLTVRNAIVNDFIPAVSRAGEILSSAFEQVGAERPLNAITVAIVGIINVGSRLVIFVAQLIKDFATGTERGQILKEQIIGLAGAIGTTLVGALVAAIVPMVALLGFINTVSRTATAAIQKIQQLTATANAPESVKEGIREFGSLDRAIVVTAADMQRANRDLLNLQQAIRGFETTGAAVPEGLISDRATAAKEFISLRTRLEQLQAFKQEVEKNNTELPKLDIKDFLEGDLPTFLTNLARDVREAMESGRSGLPDTPLTEGVFGADTGKTEQIARQIRDIERDAARDIANLQEDTVTKRIEREESTNQRLLEIATQFVTRRQQILEDAEERKAEIDRNTLEQRQDRSVLEQATNFIKVLDREHEASNQRRDLREQQALAADERRQRQRVQNAEKAISIQEQGEERFHSIQQQLLEKAFSRNQQAQDRALQQRQSNEEEALTRQLRNEATLRDEQKRLAAAKTPQERTEIQAQINVSRQDTAFSDRQQKQLTDLRKKHEAERLKFSQQQEDSAFTYRLGLQIEEFNFKLRLEQIYQQRRRELEEQEFARTDARDAGLLEIRISRAAFEANRQEQIDKDLQRFQDQLQNQQNVRQQQRIDQNARRDINKAGQTAVQQTFETLAAAELARQRAVNQQERQVRQIQQRAQERGITLAEEHGGRPTALEIALGRINVSLIQTGMLIQADKALADDFFNTVQQQQFGNIQMFAPGVDLNRPAQGFEGIIAPPATSAPTPFSIILPQNFSQLIAEGVAVGARQLATSRPDATFNVNGNVYGMDDFNSFVLRFFNSLATQRR